MGRTTMKFHIGSLIISADAVLDFKILKNFFRRPATENSIADFSWVIEVVDKCDWQYEVWDQVDNVWFTGRRCHLFRYNSETKEFKLKILRGIDQEGFYWLKRDLFGGFGSVSGQQIIHSSGIIYGDEGYIFSAASETGKTTLFNNLKGIVEQVNDESNWVYQNSAGNYMMVNQNFYFGSSDCFEVPLHAVYLLEQSPVCSISNVDDSMEAFTILLSIHPPFNFHDPFLQIRSSAIMKLQKDLQIKKFRLNRQPKELAQALFGDR